MTYQKNVFKNIMILICLIIIPALIIPVILLFISSPGKPAPLLDKDGKTLSESISEKTYVNIGGIKQGMFIRGKNQKNPILLFLHGGPGMPTYFLTEKFPTGLETGFTICYWEQRGGGLSYNSDIPAESVTTERLISDTIEVTNYLRARFKQEKIYLMGHSWGSFIGIQTVLKAPELFYAYIGVAQISNQSESEKIAYQYMLKQYQASGNTEMIEKLKQYPVSNSDEILISFFKSPIRDKAMHELGVGTMRNMKSVISEIFIPFLQTKDYTIGEKYNTFFRAKPFLINKTELINQLFETDLTRTIKELKVPIYFFSGIYDYTVNYSLSKDFLSHIKAPEKGFYTFNKSAHSPMHEEPEIFMKIMEEDVLNQVNNLADK